MLFSLSLATKLGNRGLQSNSLHPGVISTNLGNHISWETDEGMASLSRHLARASGDEESLTACCRGR